MKNKIIEFLLDNANQIGGIVRCFDMQSRRASGWYTTYGKYSALVR